MSSAGASFDDLYRTLREPVARLCLSVTGNRAAAEDAVQETFLAVHRALGAFRGESKASTWIYRIALTTALRVRARGAKEHSSDPTAEPSVTGPHEQVAAREEVRHVSAAIEKLSTEQRVVLSLFAIDGLGHAEIAELLGIPEGTVWSRLHLARKRLQTELRVGDADS